MSPAAISSVAFAFVFGGAFFGTALRAAVPKHNLTPDSKEAVKLGMALVATMAALVLGLLIASAKSSFDTQTNELTEMSSTIVLLDRILAHYGPETMEARDILRSSVVRILDRMASRSPAGPFQSDASSNASEVLFDKIQGLSPKNDAERSIQAQALGITISLGQTRWLIYEQSIASVSIPLLAVLIFWLTIIFISFGLFAPPNAMVFASFFVSALSVSGAILLILEMYTPYGGLIQISALYRPPWRISARSRWRKILAKSPNTGIEQKPRPSPTPSSGTVPTNFPATIRVEVSPRATMTLEAGTRTSRIRVLVVDDYEQFHQFVRSALGEIPQLQIVGEAFDGFDAIQKAEQLRPDLILLDIGLPGLNGLDVARRIRRLCPESKILFLSQESSVCVVETALGLGAQGYLIKADAGEDLLDAIGAVVQGRRFVSSGLLSSGEAPL